LQSFNAKTPALSAYLILFTKIYAPSDSFISQYEGNAEMPGKKMLRLVPPSRLSGENNKKALVKCGIGTGLQLERLIRHQN